MKRVSKIVADDDDGLTVTVEVTVDDKSRGLSRGETNRLLRNVTDSAMSMLVHAPFLRVGLSDLTVKMK